MDAATIYWQRILDGFQMPPLAWTAPTPEQLNNMKENGCSIKRLWASLPKNEHVKLIFGSVLDNHSTYVKKQRPMVAIKKESRSFQKYVAKSERFLSTDKDLKNLIKEVENKLPEQYKKYHPRRKQCTALVWYIDKLKQIRDNQFPGKGDEINEIISVAEYFLKQVKYKRIDDIQSSNPGKSHSEVLSILEDECDITKIKSDHPTEEKTLTTNLNHDQLKNLYKALCDGQYIHPINEIDFVYLLSGEPLNMNSKIHWKKSKAMLIYLLDKICTEFSFQRINRCINAKGTIDSHHRSRSGYMEIDDILSGL